MTCKGCNTNFCYDCGVKTPHPTGSTCVHARAGVHGEVNNNPVDVYIQPVPNINQGRQERGRPGGRRIKNQIKVNNQPHARFNQERNRPRGRMKSPIECIFEGTYI